jgi:hypothetical protein
MNIDKLVRKVLLEADETKTVKSEVDINNPVGVLTHAINTPSCFKSKGYPISEMRVATTDLATACGVAEKSNYSVGVTGNTTAYFFGYKDTVKNPNPDAEGATHFQLCFTSDQGKTFTKVGQGRTWSCKDAFAGIGDINKAILSPEQKTQLVNYVAQVGGVYSEFPPRGYTEQEYDKYDVKTIKMLGDTFVDFPEGKMFIWVRKGLMNATPDQVNEVKTLIGKLTPKLTTTIPKVGDTRMSWCVTGKGLFPTDDYLPPGISYDNLKARLDDPNSGIKKGSWTLFCPDTESIRTVNTESTNMNKCRQAIKYLYSCKTKGGRSKYNKTTGVPSDMTSTDGTESPCYDFKTQFKNRYLAYSCNSKKMYDKTIDVMGVGIKNEVNDLFSDLTTNYGLGTFNKNLKESVKTSNTLDFTINKVVLEAIKSKNTKTIDPINSIVRKNLLESLKRRRK